MAAGETANLRSAMENLSECCGALEDYRQTEVINNIHFSPLSISLNISLTG